MPEEKKKGGKGRVGAKNCVYINGKWCRMLLSNQASKTFFNACAPRCDINIKVGDKVAAIFSINPGLRNSKVFITDNRKPIELGIGYYMKDLISREDAFDQITKRVTEILEL